MGDIIWPKREQKHAKEVTCDLMMIMKEGLDFLKAMDLNTYYIFYNDTIKCYYLVIIHVWYSNEFFLYIRWIC